MQFRSHAPCRIRSAVAVFAAIVVALALALGHTALSAGPIIAACQLAQAPKALAIPAALLSTDVTPALGLKFDPGLNLESSANTDTPIYMFGQTISGQTDDWIESRGNAEFRKLGIFIKGDQIRHDLVRDEVFAEGRVKLFREGEFYEGAKLRFKPSTAQGRFDDVSYQFTSMGGRGTADYVEFIQPLQARLGKTSYTTCSRDRPVWELRMDELLIDQLRETASGTSTMLYWDGIPILPLGNMSFPVSEQRKTGLLAPLYSVSRKLGFDAQLPFYWNMAPHHDMTLYPRVISKRGEQLGTEFRFLRPDALGTLKYEILPSDRATGQTRQFGSIVAAYRPVPNVNVGLNLQRASDDNYFVDLGNSLLSSSQRLLPGQLTVSSVVRDWSVAAEVQQYQLLQDSVSPLIRPYAVEPKLAVSRAYRSIPGRDDWPIDWSLTAQAASFRHPTLVEGDRFVAMGSVAWRQFAQGFSITPKLSLHATQYSQRSPGSDDETFAKYLLRTQGTIYQNNADSAIRSYTRVLPTFSMDVGTVLERDLAFNGTPLEQTLEPRMMYVRTPYKDQSAYPVFDTGAVSLGYAQMFADSAFNGSDRVADLHQLTTGVVTRINSAQTGAELFRAGIAQRLYFSDQRVTLPGFAARTDRRSDLLGQISARPIKNLSVDGQLQYAPASSTWQSASLVSRYSPKPANAVSVAYRFVRGLSNTVDVAFQWPLFERWYAVGRYQHALKNLGTPVSADISAPSTNLVEALAGFEYDGGCWVARFVLQEYALNATQRNTAVFFQIELNGMGQVGTNPLAALSRNIPNYQLINRVTPLPAKFDNFQ